MGQLDTSTSELIIYQPYTQQNLLFFAKNQFLFDDLFAGALKTTVLKPSIDCFRGRRRLFSKAVDDCFHGLFEDAFLLRFLLFTYYTHTFHDTKYIFPHILFMLHTKFSIYLLIYTIFKHWKCELWLNQNLLTLECLPFYLMLLVRTCENIWSLMKRQCFHFLLFSAIIRLLLIRFYHFMKILPWNDFDGFFQLKGPLPQLQGRAQLLCHFGFLIFDFVSMHIR